MCVSEKIRDLENSEVLTADHAEILGCFGWSVSISSDGHYMAVGGPSEFEFSGAAYIFVTDGDKWTLQARLRASDHEDYDNFGSSVSINSDGSYVIIGSDGKSDTQSSEGAAYIFLRTNDTWAQQAKLLAPVSVTEGNFGSSVAISADAGYIVVGSDGDDENRGSAYVFVKSDNTWLLRQKMLGGSLDVDDAFGCSAAISASGDYIVIGANVGREINDGSKAQVHIYKREGYYWLPQARLQAIDSVDSEYLGISVAISGDGRYVIAGSYCALDVNGGQGSAYIFLRKHGKWSQQAKLQANETVNSAGFGRSVAISSDGGHAIVGAFAEKDATGSRVGACYEFLRSGEVWGKPTALPLSDPEVMSNFGHSVSISGSGNQIAVAACYKSGEIKRQGAVYPFRCTVNE